MTNGNNSGIRKYAPLFLRIALAAVFIVRGWSKLTGMDGTINFFSNVNVPLPYITAWVVAIFEFGGGLLVLLGWYTRVGAAAIAVVMIGAMITVKFAKGFVGGWDLDFSLLMMAVSLLFSGPGEPSVDAIQSLGEDG